jgi:uncharacterized protein YqgV (UPF0045/DUF77 family)
MKTSVAILSAFLFIQVVSAQVTFEKNMPGYAGHGCQQTSDGNYIIAGDAYNGSNGLEVALIKTDAYGDTLWRKFFGWTSYADEAYSVQETFDKGFIISGCKGSASTSLFLIKTDSMGNMQWNKVFMPTLPSTWCYPDAFGMSVRQTADSGFVVAGYLQARLCNNTAVYCYGGLVLKTDAAGNTQWSKLFTPAGGMIFYDIAQTVGGGYLVTGTFNNVLCVQKLGINGDSVSTGYWGLNGSFGSALAKKSNDTYAAFGSVYNGTTSDFVIYSVDTSCNLLSSKVVMPSFSNSGYGRRFVKTNDGGYIFTSGGAANFLVRTDSNGDTLWTRNYSGAGRAVNLAADGGFIISGAASNSIYFVKTDSNGLVFKTPSNVNADADGEKIKLIWQDKTSSESGFYIYRSLNANGPWALLDSVGANVVSYVDTSVSVCVNYFYRLRAYNNATLSDYSAVSGAVASTNAPSGLVYSQISASDLQLNWTDNSTKETAYQVERSFTGTSNWQSLGPLAANTTQFIDVGVNLAGNVFYKISAAAAACTSAPHADIVWSPNNMNQRLSLCEFFTGEDCPPSALFDPKADSLLNSNPSKIVTLKYFLPYNQGSVLMPQFYQDNYSEVDVRNVYYNCFAIPKGYIDGDYVFSGNIPSQLQAMQTMIDAHFAQLSPFIIEVHHQLSGNADSVYTQVKVKATSPVSGNLRAHVAIIERELNFALAPGSNGEKHFEGMMKKMLPDAYGTVLPVSFAAGDSVQLNLGWKLGSYIYDLSQLAVIAFVEDSVQQSVYQAGYSAPESITAIPEAFKNSGIKFYPNPFSYSAIIEMEKEEGLKNPFVIVYDLGGNEIKKIKIQGRYSEVNRENLSAGIYFYKVMDEGKILSAGKFIVQ